MLVGRIVNHEQEAQVIRGAEKGMFQYGGSTIIVLIGKDQVQMRKPAEKCAVWRGDCGTDGRDDRLCEEKLRKSFRVMHGDR